MTPKWVRDIHVCDAIPQQCADDETYEEVILADEVAGVLEALEEMCAEFRAYDLPYGSSKAYLRAQEVLGQASKEGRDGR